jgi:membrane-associated PAP2 superfamily phosphatase
MKLFRRDPHALRFAKIGVISLIVVVLAFSGIFFSCSQEKAVERLMSDPQMSKLILERIWQTPETKEALVKMVMNDPESMNKLLESVVQDTIQAAKMMDRMMAKEDLKDMLTEKTADLHTKKRR